MSTLNQLRPNSPQEQRDSFDFTMSFDDGNYESSFHTSLLLPKKVPSVLVVECPQDRARVDPSEANHQE